MNQKYAAYNAQGAIIAFYDSVDSPPPQGVVVLPITQDEWQQCLDNPGYTVVADALVAPLPPTAAELLASAQAAQLASLQASYDAAVQVSVSYMGSTFQADYNSQSILTKSLVPGSVPLPFYWLAQDNTPVTMTFAQLQGLAGVMLAQGQTAFTNLQTRKAAVRNAATVAAVQAVTW